MIKHIERVDDTFFNHLNQIIDSVNELTEKKPVKKAPVQDLSEIKADIEKIKKDNSSIKTKISKLQKDYDDILLMIEGLVSITTSLEKESDKNKKFREMFSSPVVQVKLPKKPGLWSRIKARLSGKVSSKLW